MELIASEDRSLKSSQLPSLELALFELIYESDYWLFSSFIVA